MSKDEHILSQIPGGTSFICSCGHTFTTTSEAQQHVNWHFNLSVVGPSDE